MHTKTLKELSALLQAKKISATELSTQFLDRIKASDLNAFLHVDEALTLQQAAAADQLIAQNKATPLTGIPIAHKDIFVTRGWRSTAGSKMLENYVSPFDAAVVERSRIFVDNRECVLHEADDLRVPIADGVIGPDRILGDLAELAAGTVRGRTSSTDVTLFKSVGMAIEDIAAARELYRRAVREGRGVRVDY